MHFGCQSSNESRFEALIVFFSHFCTCTADLLILVRVCYHRRCVHVVAETAVNLGVQRFAALMQDTQTLFPTFV